MIGQAGIGKSSFLKSFPSAQLQPPAIDTKTECYRIETVNASFTHKISLEIECCDLALDTCLHDSDLMVLNNKILPATLDGGSHQFINTSRFNVIILCFATNDPVSFELIKCKWAVDLKKNKQMKHAFVLLGLKNETSKTDNSVAFTNSLDVAEIKHGKLRATIKKLSPKSRRTLDKTKRSLSASSLSSTSRINNRSNFNEDDGNDGLSSSDLFTQDDSALTSTYRRLSVNHYKKFAKLISSSSENFIQYSNGELNSQRPTNFTTSISTYAKLLQSLIKSSEALSLSQAQVKTSFFRSRNRLILTFEGPYLRK
jgi:GTPase SAR1 family protein